MNLNAVVSGLTRAITPAISGVWKASDGYTIDADYQQVPAYATDAPVMIDIQPLDDRGLKHVDSLNLQGVIRGVWVNAALKGVDRNLGIGGDLLVFDDPSNGESATWLVEALLEPWSVGWCHAIVTKQVAP